MKFNSMFTDILTSFFKKPITENYPTVRPEVAERFRGKLYFDPAKCTGCNLCSKDCPSDALEIIILDRAAKKFVARYHVDRCTYCGQCVQSCKFKCIGMSNKDWELAALNKQSFEVYYGKDEDIAALLERRAAPLPEPV
jgi:formate hydrogenlyase subunit 6/NADH:ubiquinone oxidoreductase subunit I